MLAALRVDYSTPIHYGFVMAFALVILAAVFWFARRDTRSVARLVRTTVMGLMLVGVIMLAGMALGPVFTTSRPDPERSKLTILVDATGSMTLPDRYTGEDAVWIAERMAGESVEPPAPAVEPIPREEIVNLILKQGQADWLASLQDKFDIQVLSLGETVESISLDAQAPYAVDPRAVTTPLGDALATASDGVVKGAYVLISDGGYNTGRDPGAVARSIGKRQTPIFVVGVGSPEERKDKAVLSVEGPESVLAGDEVILNARVAATGMGSRLLDVELWESGDRVDRKQVQALSSGDPVAVRFTFKPRQPGRYNYEVRLPVDDTEQEKDNNKAEVTVMVERRKIRILLVETEPRYEWRFLRNVFERDWAVELTMYMARPGLGPIGGPRYTQALPIDPKELLEYDLFIIGDVAREYLPDEFLEGVARHVQSTGGALIVIAGRRGRYTDLIGTPLERILPVELDMSLARTTGPAFPFRVELTPDGARHLITQLASPMEENRRVWREEIEPVRWCAPVGELRPGALGLLVHPERMAGPGAMPLVAVQTAGAGKVMWCGIEGTWRWRKEIGDVYHYPYWAQAIRWMTRKQFTDTESLARIALSKPETRVGHSVAMDILVVDNYGYPRAGANVELRITNPEDKADRIMAVESPGSWGIYNAVYTPKMAGTHSVQTLVDGKPLGAPVDLIVTRPDLERTRLEMDLATLRDIASRSDGKYLSISELGQLPGLLEEQVEERVLTEEYSPCRHWAWYLAMAMVLSSAWFIRKRSGLA